MRNKILSIIFLVIILLIPSVTLISRVSSVENNVSPTENSQQLSGDKEINKQLDVMVDSFLDNIPVKETFAQFNTDFTRKLTGSQYINSTQVMLGKNDWLFLKATQEDYEHINCFTEQEKMQILNQLLKQREILNKAGIEFVIYIAPNKATIYPEYMPDTIQPGNAVSRAEDLINYIRDNSDLKVIYPKNELLAAKDIAPVYYVTDTHWNDIGGYIGTQVFTEEVFGFKDKLLSNMVTMKEEYREGDLSRIGGVSDIYREYKYYSIYDTVLNDNLSTDERVYFVGDSFRASMQYYMSYYIDNIEFVHYDDFSLLDMCEYNPDVVVWEIVERNINKYLELRIIEESTHDNNGIVSDIKGNLFYLPNSSFEVNENGVRYTIDGEYQKETLIEVDGHVYYFDEKGYMLSDVFKEVGEYTYYFNRIGIAKSGWIKSNGEWYYFDDSLHMVKNAWIQSESMKWYYLTDDGTMLTDAYTPDGYYVNEDGMWVQ